MSESVAKKPVVTLESVSFSRGTRKIFDDISLSLYPGEVVAIMGPSGTGKTTLMKLITGQLQADSGKITTLGYDLSRLSRRQLLQLRQRMSMLFQSGALFSDMTVAENVAFPLREKTDLAPELIDIIVKMKLHCVGLRGAADLMPSELSGGMARRAALARAIVRDPELMVYDEPFTGQDPISLGMLTKLIRNINNHLKALNMCSLVVSHDIHEVCKIADRAILLANARIAAFDTPQALYDSDDPFVRQFMYAEPEGPVAFHYPAADYFTALKGG